SDLWGRCLLYRSNDPCAGGVPAQSAFLSYHKSRPVTRRGRVLSGDAKTEMGTASLRSPSAGIWQAWRSPASLGFPLSVPAACGCHEIDHLKHRPYPMYSITQLFFFVKNFTLTEQSVETLRTDVPKGNDGIPVSSRVARYLKPQNHFCNGILFDNLLDY